MLFEELSFFDHSDEKELFDPATGLILGNMFKDEYRDYKNYKQTKFNVISNENQLLLKIYEYDFAINDLSLWLDLHPDDTYVYNHFKEYVKSLNQLVELYEHEFGPLQLDSSDYGNYIWYKNPWPFEGGNLDV